MSVTQAANSPNGRFSELEFLDSRRSVPARQLGAPGPDHDTVLRMLQSASRVPDHGRRVPFRFVRIAGDARLALGNALAALTIERDPSASEAAIEKDRQRFAHAPLVIAVLAILDPDDDRIPGQERLLSAGAACFALLQAAQALGFGADRLARPRPEGARPAGHGRTRTRRRFRPHRHAEDGSARARTPRRVQPAHGLDAALSASVPAVARPTLHLVDASLYVFRAWHSMPDQFHDADGWPTNAVHGFARFLLELLERERPRHIVVAFDEALDSCFRNALYPAYKANREPAPPELKR